jgi:hypothetical protein
MKKDCLGLDIAFVSVGSDLSELPVQGSVKATLEILGNTPMRIDGGDWIIYPGDGHVCLFETGCCLPLVRNLRFEWQTNGIANPTTQARLTILKQVELA